MNKLIISICVASSFLLSACGGSSSSDSSGSSSASLSSNACGTIGLNTRVINGSECEGLSKSPVVRIVTAYASGGVATCSGTMITQTEVLTAGHCIINFHDFSDPATLAAVITGDVGSARSISVTSYAWHPGLRFEENGEDTNTFNDIAVLYLAEPANLPVLPILSIREKIGTIPGHLNRLFLRPLMEQ